MYAIVKTGGKQYRVEEGQSLLVERLPVEDGGKAELTPLLVVDGSNVVDGSELSKATIEARVVSHERGPKLRVVKFKPKRGYKRRNGHRQELTRIEVTSIKLGGSRRGSSGGRGPKPVAAEAEGATVEAADSPEAAPQAKPTRARAKKPAAASEAVAGEKAAVEKPVAAAAEPAAEGEKLVAAAADKPAAGKPSRPRSRAKAKPAADEPKTEEGNGA